ncbi:MAG: hypothetical protein JWM34_2608 [Ilumatobacteraceae bacterium]|nr:hypothetical protein [Ilumatobacteraceae bacterium]
MTDETESIDGRSARRERGRLAVIDAMIDLVRDGHSPPSTELVAERAGVSMASLFRYFPTLEELHQQTLARFFGRYDHLFQIERIGEGPLPRRIDRFVMARIRLYETIGTVARFARLQAVERPHLVSTMSGLRRHHADITRHHFDRELAGLTSAPRTDLITSIVSLTSFESYELLTRDLGRTPRQLRRTWRHAIATLLDITP